MNKLIEINEKDLSEPNLLEKANELLEGVHEGNINALDLILVAKAYKIVSDHIVKNVEADALDEAVKYLPVHRKLHGAKFQVKYSPDSYDFEKDAEFKSLNEALKIRKEELKQAFKMNEKGKTIVDENGEVIPVVPLKKAGKSTLSVSFK